MRFVFIFLFSLVVQPAAAVECQTDPLNLNEGDVISANLLTDIVSQIQGVSRGMTANQLNGVWECTSFNKERGTSNGYTNHTDGIGAYLNQDITFQLRDNGTFVVSYTDNLGQNTSSTPSGNVCFGKLVDGALFALVDNGTDNCYNIGLYGMRKISKTCFVWEVTNSFPLASATTCVLKNEVPLAPISLEISSSSNGNQLSWTAGDDTATSYQIMSKEGATDDFAEAGTSSSISFTDSSSSRTRQYRVFAINDNGTSIGSNVVSLD